MSLIKPGPDWCSVIRVPTPLTWDDIDRATTKEREARASRVMKASGLDDSVAIEVKPPNLTVVTPEKKPTVRWFK